MSDTISKYKIGDAVMVAAENPTGNPRTPKYIRGKRGVIERLCGNYRNPEELAYGRAGLPRQPLYRVRFRQAELWPRYDGRAADTIEIEIYQHWLEPAKE